uniref:Uncharacterized protein n=1 Tax=Anguilla anguilla TaxID=7936 RepID=A0A0E9PN91_ANGAN
MSRGSIKDLSFPVLHSSAAAVTASSTAQ